MPTTGACAPARSRWRKSTYSGSQGGNCVEVGPGDGLVGVRDTKRRGAGALSVAPRTWAMFLSGVRAGRW